MMAEQKLQLTGIETPWLISNLQIFNYSHSEEVAPNHRINFKMRLNWPDQGECQNISGQLKILVRNVFLQLNFIFMIRNHTV